VRKKKSLHFKQMEDSASIESKQSLRKEKNESPTSRERGWERIARRTSPGILRIRTSRRERRGRVNLHTTTTREALEKWDDIHGRKRRELHERKVEQEIYKKEKGEEITIRLKGKKRKSY